MRTKKELKKKADGSPVMVPRIVYMEPELWQLCDRMAHSTNETRSTYIRKLIKEAHLTCQKNEGINWGE